MKELTAAALFSFDDVSDARTLVTNTLCRHGNNDLLLLFDHLVSQGIADVLFSDDDVVLKFDGGGRDNNDLWLWLSPDGIKTVEPHAAAPTIH